MNWKRRSNQMNNNIERIHKDDWKGHSSFNIYNGKYRVGCFHLTNTFIISYMVLVYGVELDNKSIDRNQKYTDDQIITYMEQSDMLTKDIWQQIRKDVKSPPDNMYIYHHDNQITKLQMV